MSGSAEHLPGDEASPVDAEEHPADPPGTHGFDINPLRQDCDFTTPHERDIP
jgi:hypothetical protein